MNDSLIVLRECSGIVNDDTARDVWPQTPAASPIALYRFRKTSRM